MQVTHGCECIREFLKQTGEQIQIVKECQRQRTDNGQARHKPSINGTDKGQSPKYKINLENQNSNANHKWLGKIQGTECVYRESPYILHSDEELGVIPSLGQPQ